MTDNTVAAQPAEVTTLTFASLPALHESLASGKFAGVVTIDGQHVAVVLLDDRPEKRLNWGNAKAWAKKVGGQLPPRLVSLLLYFTCKELIDASWIWAGEPGGSSYAWCCDFSDGGVYDLGRSAEGGAVAVRLIPLTA